MAEHLWRRIGRRLRSPVKYSYGDRSSAYSVRRVRLSGRFFDSTAVALPSRDPLRGHCEAGSLTGAVHLSNDNAGVLRPAQPEKFYSNKSASRGHSYDCLLMPELILQQMSLLLHERDMGIAENRFRSRWASQPSLDAKNSAA